MCDNVIEKKVPVLFIIFNRKDRALESFRTIKKYRPTRLYIAADGPRVNKPEEKDICETTREAILNQIDWDCELFTLFREENVGCGRGVSEAISWMFETEEYGVINEDDCMVSDDFFNFCEILLPLYKDNPDIAQINGFDLKYSSKQSNTYYFTSYPEIWGWATWKRAWVNIDFQMKSFPSVRSHIFSRFSFTEAIIHYFFWNRLYRHIKRGEKIYAWGFQWSIYVFMNRKLCINPLANLVINTGCGEGTNCNDPDTPLASAKYGKILFPLLHPATVSVDKEKEKKRSAEYVTLYRNVLFSKIKRTLKHMFL